MKRMNFSEKQIAVFARASAKTQLADGLSMMESKVQVNYHPEGLGENVGVLPALDIPAREGAVRSVDSKIEIDIGGRPLGRVQVLFNCVRRVELGIGAVVTSYSPEEASQAEGQDAGFGYVTGPAGGRSVVYKRQPLPLRLGVASVVEVPLQGALEVLADPAVRMDCVPRAVFLGLESWARLLTGLVHGFDPLVTGRLDLRRVSAVPEFVSAVPARFLEGAWQYADFIELLADKGVQLNCADQDWDNQVPDCRDRWLMEVPFRLPENEADVGGVDRMSPDGQYAESLASKWNGMMALPQQPRQQLIVVLEFEEGPDVELDVRTMQESQALASRLAGMLGLEISSRESIDFDQMGPEFLWPTGDLSAPDCRLEQFRLPCGILQDRIPDIVLPKACESSSGDGGFVRDSSE